MYIYGIFEPFLRVQMSKDSYYDAAALIAWGFPAPRF